jgi:bifunctional aspartokinase / homoserine dehydrogenase 1
VTDPAPWIILKFGGTSVASPRALRRAAVTVARTRREGRVAVVVSALAGVTTALDTAASQAARGERVARATVARLRHRHRWLLHQVAPEPTRSECVRIPLERELAALAERLERAAAFRRLTPGERAAVLATGERLAVHVFAAALRVRGLDATTVDAAGLLVAGGEPLEAEPDGAATLVRIQRWLPAAPALPVVTGFIAGDGNGGTVLLGRGGSDLSATLLASALDAARIEIWTDTPGVLSADPRLEPRARVHATLGTVQASNFARLGARVLHARTFEPLAARDIPLYVRDSFRPDAVGTRVSSTGRARLATVVSGPPMVRVAAGSGMPAARLAKLLRAHSIPALLSPLDDSLLVPASAVACVRASGIAGLRFTPGPHDARLVSVASASRALSPDAVGRALASAGVFPLAPPAAALPGVTAAVVAAADVAPATRALHALAVLAPGARASVDLVLAGARGRVGRGLLARLARAGRGRGPTLRLVAAFDTRGHIEDPRGLDPAQVPRLLERVPPRPLSESLARLGRESRRPLVFVDCTASEAIAARHASLLARGIAVVTANKHGLAACGPRWRALREAARRTPLRASTTVGAGLPVLATVRALRRQGDPLMSLRATLSGTLAYVLVAVHAGVPLSRAVAEAHEHGLTEPHPAADLSGADVARKLIIVLRAAGVALEPGDVTIEALVPAEVLDAPDAGSLIARLAMHDAAFAERVAAVHAAGRRLVYAASWDGRHARAGLLEVDARDALALARPGENVVRLRTALHDRVPMVIAGPGAGVAVTAAGVHGDVLSAARALVGQDRFKHPREAQGESALDWRGDPPRHHPAWA